MSTRRVLASAGWVGEKSLPRGPNGRALCRWCSTEVPRGRKTFCSGDTGTFEYRGDGRVLKPGHGCVHEHCLRSDPGYARKCVWARDRGQCRLCPTVQPRGGWEMDHILPVSEGGGECGLENLRTLCRPCHRRETAALAGRRAEARRAVSSTR